jgi:hypothetical protein
MTSPASGYAFYEGINLRFYDSLFKIIHSFIILFLACGTWAGRLSDLDPGDACA